MIFFLTTDLNKKPSREVITSLPSCIKARSITMSCCKDLLEGNNYIGGDLYPFHPGKPAQNLRLTMMKLMEIATNCSWPARDGRISMTQMT